MRLFEAFFFIIIILILFFEVGSEFHDLKPWYNIELFDVGWTRVRPIAADPVL